MTAETRLFRPAAYWPAAQPPEHGVVVASIVTASILGERHAVIALPAEDGFAFHAVDEDGTELRPVTPATAAQPLSQGELVELIDGADLVREILDRSAMLGSRAPGSLRFVTVASAFYPGLAAHYEAQIRRWVMDDPA